MLGTRCWLSRIKLTSSSRASFVIGNSPRPTCSRQNNNNKIQDNLKKKKKTIIPNNIIMANNIKLDNYIIVDVGANLTNKKFARDLDAVIQRQVKLYRSMDSIRNSLE